MGRGWLGKHCGIAAAVAFLLGAGPALAEVKVVISVLPIHSLVAGVMAGAGEPALLVKGGASPHAYSLRPSDARALENADLVFWIGEGLEAFLEKPLQSLAEHARVVEVTTVAGIELHQAREGGAWDARRLEGDGESHEGEDHADHDPHLWLDPDNAGHIVRAAVRLLSEADPANAARYHANGKAVLARLAKLDRELESLLTPLEARRYVVFHDSYQYLEKRYGLIPVGSITVSPGRAPGAKRLYEVRAKIIELEAACVFSEPQFAPALVETVIQGTAAKTGVLDPLGASLAQGPDAYFDLMRGLARSLRACLAPAS